ncbi:GntR family transcriptional regulator (plasmid) [Coraliomargarita sp. W4R53]
MKNKFTPLDEHVENLANAVYDSIGAAIFDGRLAPGERLRDGEIAQALGVSRTPVREAILHLTRVGLVEVVGTRFTRVTTPTPELIRETLEYTGYQAGVSIRMALPRMTDEEIVETARLLDAMIEVSDIDDVIELYSASRSFYRYVAARTANRAFIAMMSEAGLTLERNLRGRRPAIGNPMERGKLYRDLKDAVLRRDADLADLLIREQHGLTANSSVDVSELDDPTRSN